MHPINQSSVSKAIITFICRKNITWFVYDNVQVIYYFSNRDVIKQYIYLTCIALIHKFVSVNGFFTWKCNTGSDSQDFRYLDFITMEIQYGGVKTKQQMADEYGVCRKTFNRLLQKKHIRLDRGLISPKDQMIIYNELGLPGGIEKFPHFPKSSR